LIEIAKKGAKRLEKLERARSSRSNGAPNVEVKDRMNEQRLQYQSLVTENKLEKTVHYYRRIIFAFKKETILNA